MAKKKSLKKWICAASNFIVHISSCLIRQILLELNSKGLYQSSGKEKESCFLMFPTSTKNQIWHFHVVVMQQALRNVQKKHDHMQSCCFANAI